MLGLWEGGRIRQHHRDAGQTGWRWEGRWAQGKPLCLLPRGSIDSGIQAGLMQAGLEVCRARSRRIADREDMGLATGKASTMASQNLSLEGLNLEA